MRSIYPIRKQSCIIYTGLVLYIQFGVKLVFHTDVPFIHLKVQTQNRSYSPTGLVTIQFFIGRQSGNLGCFFCNGIIFCIISQIICSQISICGCSGLLGIITEILIHVYHFSTTDVSLNVTNVSFVTIAYVVHTHTGKCRQVICDSICGTQLKAKNHLLTTHVAVNRVFIGSIKNVNRQNTFIHHFIARSYQHAGYYRYQ